MNEVLSFLTAWLRDLLVSGTALLAVTCFLLVMIRSPAARMALSRGTLLGLAILSVLTSLPCWPRQSLVDLFSRGEVETEVAELLPSLPETGAAFPAPLTIHAPLLAEDDSPKSLPPTSSLAIPALINLLPMLWVGAAFSELAYMALGACRAFRLLRTASKAPAWSQQELDRLVLPRNRPPRLKASERIATAVALLAWRPHILLAARSLREDNKTAVRAALAHEWAHIRHGDLWLLALERLLLPLFCLHPLFWLLRRHIRIDQELLADAAAAGDAPVEYAQALLSWAKAENAAAAPSFGIAALSLWEHPSSLSRRVEMLLNPQCSSAAGGSRLWKWLAPPALLAAVLGLSLITLRPAAVAQDDTFIDADIQPQPQKIKKGKKAKPKNAAAKRGDDATDKSPQAAPPAGAQIFLELLVGQVEHAALEKADSSLGDLIQAASEDHCRLEGNVIVAELSPKQYSTLTVELKKADAMKILSRPSLVTLDGQEATLQIGSQVPLLRVEETVTGDPLLGVEYRNVGETIVICPHLNDKGSSRLTLDIVADHTELDERVELRTGNDTPKFITSKFRLEVEATVGKILIITERQPKKGSGRGHSILFAIGPQKIVPPAPQLARETVFLNENVLSRPGDDLIRLRNENALLHRQITDLQAKLVELEVQIRWLRAAATPGGEEKVSDEVFLRRVYLDLTGILPTADETRAFLKNEDKQKRDKLIDRLLEGSAAKKEASTGRIRWKDALSNDPNAKPSAVKPASQEGAGEGMDPDSMHIFRLARSQADDVAEVLTKVFWKAEGLAVGVEERTNSLIIRGSPEAVQKVKALLESLDSKVDPKADAEGSTPAEKDTSLQDLKEADQRAAEAALEAAKANYDRLQVLRKQDAVSEAELERALLQVRRAELHLEASQGTVTIKLRELELQVAETALRSAQTALASSEKLAAKGLLSPLELTRARVAVAERMIAVKNAKLQLENARAASASKP